MIRVVGLDLSIKQSAFADCLVDKDIKSISVNTGVFNLPVEVEKDSVARLVYLKNNMLSFIKNYDPNETMFGIESYSLQGKSNSLAQICEYGGAVRIILFELGFNFFTIAPLTLKAFVCSGRAQKDEMRLAVYKKWGFEAKTNDEIDAFGISMYGFELLSNDTFRKKAKFVFTNGNPIKLNLDAKN